MASNKILFILVAIRALISNWQNFSSSGIFLSQFASKLYRDEVGEIFNVSTRVLLALNVILMFILRRILNVNVYRVRSQLLREWSVKIGWQSSRGAQCRVKPPSGLI